MTGDLLNYKIPSPFVHPLSPDCLVNFTTRVNSGQNDDNSSPLYQILLRKESLGNLETSYVSVS